MKKTLLFLLLFFPLILLANNLEKVLILNKTIENIIIDGAIDPAWTNADSVSDFVQYQPYHGKIPSRKTVAKVITTEEALYCLMICYDERENIQDNKGKLDDFGGDIVSLMLDTFGNNRTAYKFAVTAAGVRGDCRLLDDARNRDYSWDGIWFSDSKIYDWGFVIEMRIPYKSIQYDEKLDEWGLDFDRYRPINSEDIYWCPYEENEGQRISKFGKLIFQDFKPKVRGMHLEIYPVGISKATYLHGNKYDFAPDAGIDIFYNPSPKLTFQLTANPDFAQIEADPYEFNITRYESYFSERRPFFTEGNEIFMASGRQRNTGFYRPLEIFYSRRIGKKLPDGSELPLLAGTKAFGRINQWEYGGFMATTGEKDYIDDDGVKQTEEQGYFGSTRIKRQILGNSSIGLLFVGKRTANESNGVLDIDGAFRKSNWQLAYQVARSFKDNQGDFASSFGFTSFKENLILLMRGRYIGENFDIDQVGFVPWAGTWETVGIGGPRWYYENGTIRSILLYSGGFLGYNQEDDFIDRGGTLGFNMQFRNNCGFEINLDAGDSKEIDKRYTAYTANFSSWFHTSPKWHGNVWGGYSKTYNFSREYVAFYSWIGGEFNWRILNTLQIGTSANINIEGNPEGDIEDVTYNARPYFSATPINNLNIRVYFDDLFIQSTDRTEQTVFGFLFSYNFSPKSWIYFAVNEIRDRSNLYDSMGDTLPKRLHVVDRVGVFKIKYLYYL